MDSPARNHRVLRRRSRADLAHGAKLAREDMGPGDYGRRVVRRGGNLSPIQMKRQENIERQSRSQNEKDVGTRVRQITAESHE